MDVAEGGVFFPLKRLEHVGKESLADADSGILNHELIGDGMIGKHLQLRHMDIHPAAVFCVFYSIVCQIENELF